MKQQNRGEKKFVYPNGAAATQAGKVMQTRNGQLADSYQR